MENSVEKSNPLGTEKVRSLLFKYSIPAIIGMVVNAIYNIVDRIFIGNASDLGSYGLAGITIGFPIVIIFIAIAVLFGTGGATLFAIKLGEKQKNDATKILNVSFLALIISVVVLTITGEIFLEPLLRLLGASEAVLPYAETYMRVIIGGSSFMIIGMGLNNFMRADGKPKLAMISMFIGAISNIILDPIFIYGLKMGMQGAAIATIISQMGTMIWVLAYFLSKRTEHNLKLNLMKPDRKLILQITALGLPGFVMQVANSVLNLVLNRSLFEYGGDIAVSGMGIVNSLQAFLLLPLIGLNQGAQPIISFNFGAKISKRIKDTEKNAMLFATIISTVGWLVIMIFPSQLMSMFNREPELIEFGTMALRSWFLCLPTVGFQMLGATFFQAVGKPRSSMFLTLTRQVIFLIPAILIFSNIWGINGLLYAAPFADVASATITGIWFYRGMKMISKI